MSLLLGPLRTAGRYSVRRELFSNNEQGLWLDPSDMTAGKAAWRRNLLTYSEQFDNAAWTKDGTATTNANTVQAPDGTTTADTYSQGAVNVTTLIRQDATTTSGAIVTLSFYFKQGTSGDWVQVFFSDTVYSNFVAAWFNLSTGTKGTTSSGGTGSVTSSSMSNVGNGWYRCTVTGAVTGVSTYRTGVLIVTADGGGTRLTNSNMYIWGAQLELGSTPTDYQRITDFSTEFKAAYPTHTLYQDSNGVTPCTAAGDPVGLILDQSRGGLGALGANLITSFDMTAAGWSTVGAGTTKTASTFTTTAAGGVAIGHGQANNPLTNGKVYRYTILVSCSTSSTFSFRDGGGSLMFSAEVPVSSTPVEINGLANINTTNGLYFRGSAAATYTIHSFTAREVPGNHAFQTTSASRPTLARIPSSGRRNVLTFTEQFDNGYWSGKDRITVNSNVGVAPDGTTTAESFIPTAVSGTHGIGNFTGVTTTSGQVYTTSCYAKAAGYNFFLMRLWTGVAGLDAWFNLSTGQAATVSVGASATIQSVGNGWYRCAVTYTAATTGNNVFAFQPLVANADNTASFTGDGTSGILVWGAQLETGSTATNYQKVVATTDVTESGVSDLWHLVFDGSDDSLVTNSVDFATWTQETRRNRLVDTESFAAATWTKIAVTANDNATTDPNGGNTACRLVETTATSEHRLDLTTGLSFTSGLTYTVSIYAKAAERTRIRFGFSELFQMPGRAYFDLSNGTTDNAIAGTTAAIENAGNGWYRCSVTCTCTGNVTSKIEVNLVSTGTTVNYTGDTANGVLIWGAQVDTGALTTYQRVGADEMTVIAGVRKLSDAIRGMVVELSASWQSNNGTFAIEAPEGTPGTGYRFVSKGTSSVGQTPTPFTAPLTRVLTLSADISSPSLIARVNSSVVATSTASQGTGNFGNHVVWIGNRNGAGLPYNGHLYQLIIRGKTTPTGKLLEAERYTAKKTGVTGI